MHTFPGLLSYARTDILADAEYVANGAVRVFHAHIDDAAIIGDAVKGGVHLDAALAQHSPYVMGKHHVGTILIGHFLYHPVKLKSGRWRALLRLPCRAGNGFTHFTKQGPNRFLLRFYVLIDDGDFPTVVRLLFGFKKPVRIPGTSTFSHLIFA